MYVGTPLTAVFEPEGAVEIPWPVLVRVGAKTQEVGRVSEV